MAAEGADQQPWDAQGKRRRTAIDSGFPKAAEDAAVLATLEPLVQQATSRRGNPPRSLLHDINRIAAPSLVPVVQSERLQNRMRQQHVQGLPQQEQQQQQQQRQQQQQPALAQAQAAMRATQQAALAPVWPHMAGLPFFANAVHMPNSMTHATALQAMQAMALIARQAPMQPAGPARPPPPPRPAPGAAQARHGAPAR